MKRQPCSYLSVRYARPLQPVCCGPQSCRAPQGRSRQIPRGEPALGPPHSRPC